MKNSEKCSLNLEGLWRIGECP